MVTKDTETFTDQTTEPLQEPHRYHGSVDAHTPDGFRRVKSFMRGYFDRSENDTVLSEALVLKKLPDKFPDLRDIDSALAKLKSPKNTAIDIDEFHYIEEVMYNNASQSRIFRLIEKETEKTIAMIKVRKDTVFSNTILDPFQNYHKEAMQVEEIRTTYKDELEEIGITLPLIFFASPAVMIQEYISGVSPESNTSKATRIEKFKNILESHISIMRDSKLWKGISQDIINHTTGLVRYDNFIEKHEKLFCIDMFVFTINKQRKS